MKCNFYDLLDKLFIYLQISNINNVSIIFKDEKDKQLSTINMECGCLMGNEIERIKNMNNNIYVSILSFKVYKQATDLDTFLLRITLQV